jgi:hypothetical protein
MKSFNRHAPKRPFPSNQNSRKARDQRANIEPLETRVLLSAAIESVNGTGNNLANTLWGSAGVDLIRLAAAAYSDGVSSPALTSDQSARAISNILNSQADPSDPTKDIATVDGNSLSDYGYAFGQFMDHDLDLTPDGGASFPIAVAPGDPIGPNDLPFTRSVTDPATGTSTSNPLQQTTVVTSYFDLSQVYGSSQIVSDALRTFKNGLMKTSPGNMLPYDNTTYFTQAQIDALNMANDAMAAPESALFATGDRRGNENIELTALQTLFMRNHNRVAGLVQQANPTWSDEQIYQEARKLNIAEYQNIVYNGWIPAVLGTHALTSYTGYNPKVNATISNEFSTVAFRFGHSLLSSEIERSTNNGADIADVSPAGADISLAQDFFDPYLLNPTGAVDPLTGHTSTDIGAVLKGEADGVSQANDLLAINDVRNLLFGDGGFGGEDLMARDVQRDRDNGIPDYNSLRVSMGLKPVTSFAQITSDVTVQKELAQAYPGGVNTIDAFEGGLAEDHVAGSDVGPLFQAIMVNQFARLRSGDRFFYLNEHFSPSEMRILQQGNTLTQVIEANTNLTNLQADIFHFSASISGTITIAGDNHNRPGPFWSEAQRPGSPAPLQAAGYTVELLNDDGQIVATALTDRNGHYRFTQLSGSAIDPAVASGMSATGTYTVAVVLPSGARLTSPVPKPINVTRGDTNVNNVNFQMTVGSSRLISATTLANSALA